MKLLSKSYVKGDEGSAKLIPEECKDIQHVFALSLHLLPYMLKVPFIEPYSN
jgi:hypothetical protein